MPTLLCLQSPAAIGALGLTSSHFWSHQVDVPRRFQGLDDLEEQNTIHHELQRSATEIENILNADSEQLLTRHCGY